ncbi:MAG: PAS domain S-box protein [Acidimicrobiales bacterium]
MLSEDDLEVFLEMSSDLFGVFDMRQGLVWSNDAAAATLGYTPEELASTPIVDLIHPDDMAETVGVFGRAATEHEPFGVQTRYRAKDGTWRWLEWTARVDSATGLVCGAARDVTAGHLAQAELAASEARLQAILDHSTSAVFVKDMVGRYVLVNEAFVRTLRIDRADILGRTAQEIWPGATIHDEDERVLSLGQTFTRDDTVELDDGPHLVMTVRFPLLDASGDIVGMAAIATDITDRAHAEAALAERQRLLDTVIRACPDIVTVLDGNGRVQEISEAAERILGYDMDDPVHEEVAALVHPDDLPLVYEEYAKILTTPDVRLDVRYRVRHCDGRWVVLDTRGQSITGADGKPAGVVVVSRDVTADLEIEEEMRAAMEVAEQASRAKSEFLSRMSHELRTPLNSVLGFSQLLEMDELPDQQGEAVGHIMRAGRHLLNLIDEVLDIARIESGNLELLIEPVPVGEVLGDAVDLAGPLAHSAGIEVVLDTRACPRTCHALADRQRLLQVLLNLLSNAVKYNRVGGRVDISAALTKDGGVRIEVTDTGTGIDPGDIDRVFEPFDRLGAESTTVEGTGVGLTLSRHLVERMDGVISVHSALGEGTTFTVELPGTEAPSSPGPAVVPRLQGTRESGTVRVLHIEDNLANLELVEQVLMRTGVVELYAAMSGSLGFELAREHHPDLILLDLHLPDMSGTDLLERLQGDPRTAAIPVVVITADATPAQVQRVRASGVAAYLTKPIDVRELLRITEATPRSPGPS